MARHQGTRIIVCLLLLSLLGTGGCGGSGMVSGKVKFRGKPLTAGQIMFFDSRDRQIGSASIGSDGNYSATLPTGLLKIAVATPTFTPLKSLSKAKAKEIAEKVKKMKKGAFNPLEGAEEGESQEPSRVKPITLPPKYADAGKSGLSLTVTGGPQTFDIDLQ